MKQPARLIVYIDDELCDVTDGQPGVDYLAASSVHGKDNALTW